MEDGGEGVEIKRLVRFSSNLFAVVFWMGVWKMI